MRWTITLFSLIYARMTHHVTDAQNMVAPNASKDKFTDSIVSNITYPTYRTGNLV